MSRDVAVDALRRTEQDRKWPIKVEDVDEFLKYVRVEPLRTVLQLPGATAEEVSTDVLEITVRAPTPRDAVMLSSAMATAFSRFYGKVSHETAKRSRELMESDLTEVKKDLETARAALDQFVRTNGVANLRAQQESAVQLYGTVTSQYEQAVAASAESDLQVAAVRNEFEHNADLGTYTTTNPYIQSLQANLADMESQLEVALSRYREAHPRVQELRSSISDLQSRLDQQMAILGTQTGAGGSRPAREETLLRLIQLEGQAKGASARVERLREAVGRQGAEIDRVAGLASGYERLTSDHDLYLQQYNTLQASLRDARFAEHETGTTGAVQVIDEPRRARGPVGISKFLLVLYAALLAIVLGSVALIGMDYLDTRVRTSGDVERLLEIPVAAVIPELEGAPRDLCRLTYADPLSPAAEAYRFLRTDLIVTAEEKGLKALMAAGVRPGQGVTTTITNLAIAMAQSGKTTVLIDADLRRPSLHDVFGIPNRVGLTNVLGGEAEPVEVMQKTDIENLAVIPAGPLPTNPSELLGSARMLGLIQTLKTHVDYVLFDTPPASAFTDAAVLSSVVDGVILVVRAHESPTGAERQVRTLFEKAKANLVGVVLNGVAARDLDSYVFHTEYQPLAPPPA
jgi:succinoglycan biosynthesis transport protein ExoP